MHLLPLLAAAITVLGSTISLPEIIPGPGLPSLESLGLTSAELRAMPRPTSDHNEGARSLDKRWTNTCAISNAAYTNVDDLWGCYNYLNSLGTTRCGINEGQENIRMCEHGDAHVSGSNPTRRAVSSYCSDVATAVRWVIDNCARGNTRAGDAAAWGNGDLIITSADKRYF
ncbi:hypothetical protein PWT90_06610 [Aphanocladium album]|nr:hypothetical protein PWT90_06610 [Aphanocladium album]